MRRTLASLFASSTVFLLAACGGGEGDASEAGTGATVGATSTSTSAGTTETSKTTAGPETTEEPTTEEPTTTTDDPSSSTTFKFDLPDPDLGDDTSDTETTGGVDESTCEAAAESLTSAGCLFAPIVAKPSGSLPWAVIAANTGEQSATAQLTGPLGQMLGEATIAPGQLHVFEFDANAITSHGLPIPVATGLTTQALRLESDFPIVAYEFDPYSSSQVATADASLLLPAHAWGDNYLASMAKNDGTTWLTVVNLEPDNEVEVFVPSWAAGATMAGGGIPSIAPGSSHTVVLQPQQTLRIQAPQEVGEGITGTAVYSDKPVAVYVGSPGMSLPGPGFQAWKDSLEEQIPPRNAWGTEYAAIKFQPRSIEHDLYRIVADKDGTVVTLTGDYEAMFELDEGEVVEFMTDQSFYATGTEAFLLAHFLVSASENSGPKNDELFPGWFVASNNCGNGPGDNNTSTDMGDPAITFIPPTDQFRNRYTFLTPYTYAWDMISVVAHADGWNTITLDGQPLPAPAALNGGDLVYTRILIEDGPHHIESPSTPFGLEVYGYDCRISYAYAGGLSLGSINIPPPPPG